MSQREILSTGKRRKSASVSITIPECRICQIGLKQALTAHSRKVPPFRAVNDFPVLHQPLLEQDGGIAISGTEFTSFAPCRSVPPTSLTNPTGRLFSGRKSPRRSSTQVKNGADTTPTQGSCLWGLERQHGTELPPSPGTFPTCAEEQNSARFRETCQNSL